MEPRVSCRREIASHELTRGARVEARVPMRYGAPAAAGEDRPPHVRAASGMQWFGESLLVIQDDANYLARVDPRTGLAEALPLAPGPGGRRVFDEQSRTKALKFDLEACVLSELDGTPSLVAFGSGSSPLRERMLWVCWPNPGEFASAEVRDIAAHSLYAQLRAQREFSGSELNLEGAVLRGNALLLFQRGNGAARAGAAPVNAVGRLDWPSVCRYLREHGVGPAPALEAFVQYDLGQVGGAAFTFTDATCIADERLLFLASAEASPNAVDDGEVKGSMLGVLERDGAARMLPLLDESGRLSRDKAEGIAVDPRDAQIVWLSVDRDDPSVPAELLRVRLPFAV